MSFDRAHYINQPSPVQFELKTLFKQDQPLVIFEIGACEGEDSVKYGRLFPQAKIFTFEPLPDNLPLIERNFSQYGVKNGSIHNVALSDKNGEAEFFVSSGRPEGAAETDWDFGNKSSSLLPPEKHLETAPFIQFRKKIVVKTVTLKSFCTSHRIGSIDYIHMDVQGAELMVLEGAEDFISNIKVIWLEVSQLDFYKNQPLVDDIKNFMKKHQFVLVKDAVNGIQGDQLYVSTRHFSRFQLVLITQLIRIRQIIIRVLQKLRLIN